MFYKHPNHSRSFPAWPLRTRALQPPALPAAPPLLSAPVFLLAIALLGFFPSGASGQSAPDSLLHKRVDDSLSRVLLVIDQDDQKYRRQIDNTLHKYGGGSPQMAALYRKMALADSINLVKVTAILISTICLTIP